MIRFKKERFSDWERISLKEKYSLKGIAPVMVILLVVILVGSFVFPILPYRGVGNWHPPVDQQEYMERVKYSLIGTPILLLLFFGLTMLRSTIDLKLNYKKTADFPIMKIVDLGVTKFLLLGNWRLFKIQKNEDYFDKVREGQYIQIKRTATHKLIDYYVYEK